MTEIFEIDTEDLALTPIAQTKQELYSKQNRGRLPNGAPNPVDCYVGQRLRLLREVHNISQEYLAKTMGLSFQQVQKYEQGRNRICASRLFDFASFFDVEVDFFYQVMPQEIAQMSPACLNNKDFKTYIKQNNEGLSFDELKLLSYFRRIKETGDLKCIVQIVTLVVKLSNQTCFLAY